MPDFRHIGVEFTLIMSRHGKGPIRVQADAAPSTYVGSKIPATGVTARIADSLVLTIEMRP